jgi:hypothetical protein
MLVLSMVWNGMGGDPKSEANGRDGGLIVRHSSFVIIVITIIITVVIVVHSCCLYFRYQDRMGLAWLGLAWYYY